MSLTFNTAFLLALCILSVFMLPLAVVADQKGRIISGTCPLSCRTMGRDLEGCREWREGKRCYVEILTGSDARKPTPVPVTSPEPVVNPNPLPMNKAADRRLLLRNPIIKLSPERQAALDAQREKESCARVQKYYRSSPQIEIFEIKDAGYKNQGKYRIVGAVSGMCLTKAGYYENGELVRDIPIKSDRNYSRYLFNFLFHPEEKPEIRVYLIGGARVIKALKVPAKRAAHR